MEEKTFYGVFLVCENCDHSFTMSVKKGVLVEAFLYEGAECELCGCSGYLRKGEHNEWNSFHRPRIT